MELLQNESSHRLILPEHITKIGNNVFKDCSSLVEVDLPNNLTTIGDYAFAYCTSLESVDLPDTVTTIGYPHFIIVLP
ncbi:leucine-rich repeat domain-containing protein [bacterium]|nr:leucine-rich repeat domain-containing protein [bacterium]